MAKIKGTLLIVDDSEDILAALSFLLDQEFETVITRTDPATVSSIQTSDRPDLILLDMNFSTGINTGNEGLYWLHEIIKQDPYATVILMTAYAEIELAVNGIKAGAVDFIEKPWDDDKLIATLRNAYRLNKSEQKVRSLENKQHVLMHDIQKQYEFVLGKSETMRHLDTLISKVADSEANVLILGENGSGKELVAREIHRRSIRSSEAFISVDLSSIPDTLLESELFGHAKGAFTGANEDRVGRFEIAEEGTLFLDEIGNIPLSKQIKLLQVIQERYLTKVGSNRPIPLNFRLLSATNSSIEAMIAEGSFREDLYYRLNTVTLRCPPLREHIEDIPDLLEYFFLKYSNKYLKPKLSVAPEVADHLSVHKWPGNIRELDHVIEKAIILGTGKILNPQDFDFGSTHFSNHPVPKSFKLAENEWILIEQAIQKCTGNMSKASELLGISRKTLYNKLGRHSD